MGWSAYIVEKSRKADSRKIMVEVYRWYLTLICWCVDCGKEMAYTILKHILITKHSNC